MIHLQIITPEKSIFDDEVEKVSIPTATGAITILPHHSDLITKVVPGELMYFLHSQEHSLACGFGFAEIGKDQVKVLVDLAAYETDIDEQKIEEAKRQAQEIVEKRHNLSEEEYAIAAANLQKALAQLKIKRRHKARMQ